MCEHKNLRTVGDRLFCKDCKEELPLEFLTEGLKKEDPAPEAEVPEVPEVPEAEVPEVPEVPEAEVPAEVSEPAREEQKPDIQPAEEEVGAIPAPKKERAKTTRKTAKKGE